MFKPTECLDLLVTSFFPKKPEWTKLVFTHKAWLKMVTYAHLAGNLEIAGYGRVVGNEVVDVKLIEQEVSQAKVEASAEAEINFVKEIPPEELEQWILDWHSHVDMGAFSSTTDDKNYRQQWECRGKKQFPILIINKRQEYFAQCFVSPYNRPKMQIEINGDNQITEQEYEDLYNQCLEDVLNKVSERKVTYTSSNWGYTDFYKKKDTEKSEREKDSNLNTFEMIAEECISCKCGLNNSNEFIRGICDDCWERMSWQEKKTYCDSIGITLSQAEGYCY